MKCFLILFALISSGYAYDDSHNHPKTKKNCGTDYMFPGNIARLGSHTFMLLGEDGENHVLAAHRSGTPPHNYQYVLRLKLDGEEMKFYKKLRSESKTLPSFTTIFYSDAGKKLDRTFFCLADLESIFGSDQKNGDGFEKLFPIRGSLLKDGDHEGQLNILKSFYPGHHFALDRNEVELVVYRYMPSYLPQTSFRKAIKNRSDEILPLLKHAPIAAIDSKAASRKSYVSTDGAKSDGGTCPKDSYLKKTTVARTTHSFLLMAEADASHVLAISLYDQAPHNFQTLLKLKLSQKEMGAFREARNGATPPLLQTDNYFCYANIKKLVSSGKFTLKGTLYKGSSLRDYKLGQPMDAAFAISSKNIEVLVNRNLPSLMNPIALAEDVLHRKLGGSRPKGFVSVASVNPNIAIEMRYFSEWNFLGRVVPGYRANKCILTNAAAEALSKVQTHVEKSGYSLLIFDCYRPKQSVAAFVEWANDKKDQKMKEIFYPELPKLKLLELVYISGKSGHSRASSIDLTLIKGKKREGTLRYREAATDCTRERKNVPNGQINMGSIFDCFSNVSHTASPKVSSEARKNRLFLKSAMEKFGFYNYSKEWWHYVLKKEPQKKTYFDFPVE
jgi:zinc D-Ala-D-Ala dipeptidase